MLRFATLVAIFRRWVKLRNQHSLLPGLPEDRKTPQDAANRRKPPQDATRRRKTMQDAEKTPQDACNDAAEIAAGRLRALRNLNY